MATLPRSFRIIRLLLAGLLLNGTGAVADLYDEGLGGIGITGVDAPSQVGSWPLLAEYSWLNRDSTGLQSTISWRLHPGTDDGIIFFLAQPPQTLTSEFTMLNLSTALYSTGNGITIDGTTIDMSNLRKSADGNVFNIGSGPGVDPMVPLVEDITALMPGENGWQINTDGSYNLLFNTIAECQGCRIRIHLYGNQMGIG
ncbi:MAG TPA: hypothetical protein VET88_09055, partial [Gammaproteobacteria bacterium]|nr:hypothetical protein [Gammaproteobacteria bacterium]